MDLVLWRHAEAHEAAPQEDDLARALTARGEKQASRMAIWLDRQLPQGARLLASPARRTEQTIAALGRKYKLSDALAPDSPLEGLLDVTQWPTARGTTLVVGHQPVLGQVVAQLLGMQPAMCAVRKGAVWWLRHRVRDGVAQTVLLTVQSPELL